MSACWCDCCGETRPHDDCSCKVSRNPACVHGHGPLCPDCFGPNADALATLRAELERVKAERDEAVRKGEQLCCEFGPKLIALHDAEASLAALRVELERWQGMARHANDLVIAVEDALTEAGHQANGRPLVVEAVKKALAESAALVPLREGLNSAIRENGQLRERVARLEAQRADDNALICDLMLSKGSPAQWHEGCHKKRRALEADLAEALGALRTAVEYWHAGPIAKEEALKAIRAVLARHPLASPPEPETEEET